MKIDKSRLEELNQSKEWLHSGTLNGLLDNLASQNIDGQAIIEQLSKFQVAIPSWALGAGGTRFGRYNFGGEPSNLEQKIYDVGIIHSLTGSAGAISLHIPWDIPSDAQAIKELASDLDIKFDAVNSNTFQDQKGQKHSYKFGSLCNESSESRNQAVAHNIEVIKIGEQLGSKSITVWLADGSSFPGQMNFRRALDHTSDSLKRIYAEMPSDWSMFIEYKPYEPHFYHTVIQDWGTSFMLANECGDRAYTLVDLGHHLPNTNIEHIVSTLMYKGKLGGFHFNDSKYGDDDLTVGSIKPYQLFLIFNELVFGMLNNNAENPDLSWMIDASHNLKDPLEDLMESLDAILIAYAQALLVDQALLKEAQQNHDVSYCQQILQNAFRTDVRPLVRQARINNNAASNPIEAYRKLKVRKTLIDERGMDVTATGL
ncbi:sugar isomerase [Portibacter lacus]|uniref:Sugar isomerase R00627 n=1 Tax=Portibacter lacus TaxID=1099794 RepID=A0AA37SVP6_9BACT|nr:sugar isomerase [Portibacter lacus]GLR18978.1 putative sugar isomerase R00627 [Portibacter lacus]